MAVVSDESSIFHPSVLPDFDRPVVDEDPPAAAAATHHGGEEEPEEEIVLEEGEPPQTLMQRVEAWRDADLASVGPGIKKWLPSDDRASINHFKALTVLVTEAYPKLACDPQRAPKIHEARALIAIGEAYYQTLGSPIEPTLNQGGDLDCDQWHTLPEARKIKAAFRLAFMLTPPVVPKSNFPTFLRAYARVVLYMNPPLNIQGQGPLLYSGRVLRGVRWKSHGRKLSWDERVVAFRWTQAGKTIHVPRADPLPVPKQSHAIRRMEAKKDHEVVDKMDVDPVEPTPLPPVEPEPTPPPNEEPKPTSPARGKKRPASTSAPASTPAKRAKTAAKAVVPPPSHANSIVQMSGANGRTFLYAMGPETGFDACRIELARKAKQIKENKKLYKGKKSLDDLTVFLGDKLDAGDLAPSETLRASRIAFTFFHLFMVTREELGGLKPSLRIPSPRFETLVAESIPETPPWVTTYAQMNASWILYPTLETKAALGPEIKQYMIEAAKKFGGGELTKEEEYDAWFLLCALMAAVDPPLLPPITERAPSPNI
jgi:hypothetical protein